MLELHVYVTNALNLVYMEVIFNIIYQIFTRKTALLPKKNCQGILLTNMLASLEIHNSFVSDVYMEYISGIICQFRHLYQEKCFIKKEQYLNYQRLCYHYCVSTSSYIYYSVEENSQHSKLSNSDNNNISMDNYKWEIFPKFILA